MPEPKELVATLRLERPDDAWQTVRELSGRPALPHNFGFLLATILGLPRTLSGLIDDEAPVVGVLLGPVKPAPRTVFAVHLRSGRELVAGLTTGSAPTHEATVEPQTGTTLLKDRAGKTGLAVLSDHLLVGLEGELVGVAPYVVFRAGQGQGAARSQLKVEVPAAGLAAIAVASKNAWDERVRALRDADREQRFRRGRNPDFAEPEALLSAGDAWVEQWRAVLSSASRAELSVDIAEGRVRIRAELSGSPGGAARAFIEGMRVGGAGALLDLPRVTEGALLVRFASDTGTANRVGGFTRALRDRLTITEREATERALSSLGESLRGELVVGVLEVPEASRAAFLRAPGVEAESFVRAVEETLALAKYKAFSEPLRAFFGLVSVGRPVFDSAADLRRAEARFSGTAGAPTESAEVSWRVNGGTGSVVAKAGGTDSAWALLEKPGERLSGEPDLKEWAVRHSDDVAWALVLRGFGGASSVSLFAVGRSSEHAWAEAVLDVRQLATLGASFSLGAGL